MGSKRADLGSISVQIGQAERITCQIPAQLSTREVRDADGRPSQAQIGIYALVRREFSVCPPSCTIMYNMVLKRPSLVRSNYV